MGSDLVPVPKNPWPDSADDLVADPSLPYYDVTDEPQRKVVVWRMRELMRHGMDAVPARLLAGRRDIELHEATAMLDSGCPPHLTLEILL